MFVTILSLFPIADFDWETEGKRREKCLTVHEARDFKCSTRWTFELLKCSNLGGWNKRNLKTYFETSEKLWDLPEILSNVVMLKKQT